MSFLSYLLGRRPPSASVAKERLQIILAHERGSRGAPDYLPALKEELMAVISKYISVNKDDIKVSLEKQDNYEVLELNIVLPESGIVHFTLVNAVGEMLINKDEQAIIGSPIIVNTSNLSNGFYFVKLNLNGKQSIHKIVISK